MRPAKASRYKEGNSVDLRANVVFLGVGRLGNQTKVFREAYFQNAVPASAPALVVPIHWDDFFRPLSPHLRTPWRIINDVPVAFEFLKKRLGTIKFRIVQGCQSILLFRNGERGISNKSVGPPADC